MNSTIILHTEEEWRAIEARKLERKRRYYATIAKQKFMGFMCIALGIVIPIIIRDATISVFLVPIGLYALVTRKRVFDV